MADIQTTPFDKQCLEALKSIGKTLGQMSLYKVGHPAVAATLKLAEEHLLAALTQTTDGDLSFSIDHDKLIANGRIIGIVGQVPNSVPGLFNRFKIGSLTFKTGLGNAELVALCEMAAMKPDPAAPIVPKDYLGERSVTHIDVHEAAYTKIDAANPAAGSAAAAGEGEATGGEGTFDKGGAEQIIETAEQKSIDQTIQVLVNKAVADPAQREKVYGKVMNLLEEDVQKRIEEVVKPLRTEKNILQNEQARTQSVLANMVDGVIVVDDQGKILMMNPMAEQIYGTKLAQAAGIQLTDKTGQEHMVTLASEIATPSDRPISKDVKIKADEDTKRTLKTAGAVVQNEAGKVVGMVSSLTDVAKQKEFQRMQRDFVAHVTHELRAPLSSIRAALEILQGETAGKIKEEEGRILSTALKNSDRLADLINSILDFSKIESGQMTVYPKKADAEKIGREAVDSLGAWASKKRVGLSLIAAPNMLPVSADSGRTVQVLVNLLSNAIKFTPVGGQITVRVGVSPTGSRFTGTDKSIEFSVTDTGCGIPKAEQKRVFEKFVQIASGELHVGGTGLGLSIAKALVHLQGGKMWLESDEGKGATFYFTVPVWVAGQEAVGGTPLPKLPSARPWWKKLLGLK